MKIVSLLIPVIFLSCGNIVGETQDINLSEVNWKYIINDGRENSFDALNVYVDYDGSAYIAGRAFGEHHGVELDGFEDIFIDKINKKGDLVWFKTVQSEEGSAKCLTIKNNGNIYLGGGATDAFGLEYDDSRDAVIIELDKQGNHIWHDTIEGSRFDIINDIQISEDGSIYFAGCSYGGLSGIKRFNDKKNMIGKYSSDKDQQWLVLYEKTIEAARAQSIDVDEEGNCYILGDSRAGFTDGQGFGSSDIVVLKYSSTGKLVWDKIIGTDDYDVSSNLKIDREGFIYITGSVDGDLFGNENMGEEDQFLIKLDKNGEIIWTRTMGTENDETGKNIIIDTENNVYVIGRQGAGDITRIFISKYMSDGKAIYENKTLYDAEYPENAEKNIQIKVNSKYTEIY